MWGDSCFQLTPGTAKIAYGEVANTKTKFFAPFCNNIIIIAHYFPSKVARCCFFFAFLRSIMTQKQLGQLNTHSVNNKASSKSGSEAG